VVNVQIPVPDGTTASLKALVDNGAQINLISQAVVQRYGLVPRAAPKPNARFLDENPMTIYEAHELEITVQDADSSPRMVRQLFHGASFKGYDMVLGWDWLAASNPLIDFRKGSFVWSPEGGEQLEQWKLDEIVDGLQSGVLAIQLDEDTFVGGSPADDDEGYDSDWYEEEEMYINSIQLGRLMDSISLNSEQGGGDRDPTTIDPNRSGKACYVAALAIQQCMKAACDPHVDRYPELKAVPHQAFWETVYSLSTPDQDQTALI
jgi:hypothetical protein